MVLWYLDKADCRGRSVLPPACCVTLGESFVLSELHVLFPQDDAMIPGLPFCQGVYRERCNWEASDHLQSPVRVVTSRRQMGRCQAWAWHYQAPLMSCPSLQLLWSLPKLCHLCGGISLYLPDALTGRNPGISHFTQIPPFPFLSRPSAPLGGVLLLVFVFVFQCWGSNPKSCIL